MIYLKKRLESANKRLEFEQFLNEEYMITIVGEHQKLLFLGSDLQTFVVNEGKRQLVPIPNTNSSMDRIKELLGDVWIQHSFHGSSHKKGRWYSLMNDSVNAPGRLSGKVCVLVDDRLKHTVSSLHNLYESERQFFKIPLKVNELLSFVETNIEIQGQSINSKMEIIELKEAPIPSAYRNYLEYDIVGKVA